MNLSERIASFEFLGNLLRMYHEQSEEPALRPLQDAARHAFFQNPWFTPVQIRTALNSLGRVLTRENLERWISLYQLPATKPAIQRTIGVVMAGNIPAVGFHDFLCVLISGHRILAKLSASDDQILPGMAGVLCEYNPEWREMIIFTTGKLENFEAVIATGSTNTSRYFEYYFGRYPNIIRKNRNSVAVLNGQETESDLHALAGDILLYFGMGCRSISKVYVPHGYDFTPLIMAFEKFRDYADHNKFRNNYEYTRSILLVNQDMFMDNGFFLLKEDASITSRIAMLHYEFYRAVEEVVQNLHENMEFIQCIVSNMNLNINHIQCGDSQNPALWDYADGVDTMAFLASLK